MELNYNELKLKVEKYEQEHLMKFWDELDENGKNKLLEAINYIDFEELEELKKLIKEDAESTTEQDLKPSAYVPFPKDGEDDSEYLDYHNKGVELLKQGKVAAILVAGGQGTRLGYDAPKGTFPIMPISNNTLFYSHFEILKALQENYNTEIPFLIMTSEMTHNDTVNFLEANNYYGYDKDNVFVFQQGKMPCIDMQGKILLTEKDCPAFAPNGHGGTIFGLKKSGLLEKLMKKGIEHIFYFQVDNVLVKICEPYFLGCHIKNNSDISLKVLEKAYPEEKLGIYAIDNGKPCIIEYSDLSEKDMYSKDANGNLKYRWGSPAIHIFSLNFIKEFTDKYKNLPFHKAIKKIPFVDENGNKVSPEKPNGIKFEMFIFDILPYSTADKVTAVEGIRSQEFAPLKNKEGIDSIDSARELYIEECVRRLKRAGLKDIPRDDNGKLLYKIEIGPSLIVKTDKLKEKIKDIKKIQGDIYIK